MVSLKDYDNEDSRPVDKMNDFIKYTTVKEVIDDLMVPVLQ